MEGRNILCNLKITLGLIKLSSFIIYSCIKVIVSFDLSGYAKFVLQYLFFPFPVAVNIQLNHKMESSRKHHFTLGNMAIDIKKSKCLSLLSRTSVMSNTGVFIRYLQIVSEDLDYWFLRGTQTNFLLVSSAFDTYCEKVESFTVYTAL